MQKRITPNKIKLQIDNAEIEVFQTISVVA